jgi:hypothetical protein
MTRGVNHTSLCSDDRISNNFARKEVEAKMVRSGANCMPFTGSLEDPYIDNCVSAIATVHTVGHFNGLRNEVHSCPYTRPLKI